MTQAKQKAVCVCPSSRRKTNELEIFELQEFFPYLVRVFYADVTSAISAAYQNNNDLSPAEWRSMVILGVNNSLTANEIVERSSMDKVMVSRAVKRLKQNGLVEVDANTVDGRSKLLSLSRKGAKLYKELLPSVLEVERKLLTGINKTQLSQFLQTMNVVRENKARYLL